MIMYMCICTLQCGNIVYAMQNVFLTLRAPQWMSIAQGECTSICLSNCSMYLQFYSLEIKLFLLLLLLLLLQDSYLTVHGCDNIEHATPLVTHLQFDMGPSVNHNKLYNN